MHTCKGCGRHVESLGELGPLPHGDFSYAYCEACQRSAGEERAAAALLPGGAEERPTLGRTRMREVLRTHQLSFAEAARIALEAEGIAVEMVDANALGSIGLAGEIRIAVPEDGYERAHAIVAPTLPRARGKTETEDLPHVFLPLRQATDPDLIIVVRSDADPSALAGPVREAIRSVDPGLPIPALVPAQSLVARATQEQRTSGQVAGGLGLLVLLLSAMGVHGVVALAVTNRTREIGLRIAMGATRGMVVRGVLWDALRMAGPGLLVGGLLAAGTAAAMRSMLLGLSPVDPVSFLIAGVLLLCVVITSSLGPALRASGIHPMEALRSG